MIGIIEVFLNCFGTAGCPKETKMEIRRIPEMIFYKGDWRRNTCVA